MIQSGGWCRLRVQDEHTKLARIALYFSPLQDDAFKIDVSKMRVLLPPEIRDKINEEIKSVVRIAQDAYRKRGREGKETPVQMSGTGKSTKGKTPQSRVRSVRASGVLNRRASGR